MKKDGFGRVILEYWEDLLDSTDSVEYEGLLDDPDEEEDTKRAALVDYLYEIPRLPHTLNLSYSETLISALKRKLRDGDYASDIYVRGQLQFYLEQLGETE